MPKSKRALRKIPTFKSEAEEFEFWATADSTEYIDWSKARVARFPKLRPSSTAISVRLPNTLLTDLKLLANERDVPYQSLLKVYLADRVATEHGRRRRRAGA
jgi:predicted DNA binding CopG/RHH family protein